MKCVIQIVRHIYASYPFLLFEFKSSMSSLVQNLGRPIQASIPDECSIFSVSCIMNTIQTAMIALICLSAVWVRCLWMSSAFEQHSRSSEDAWINKIHLLDILLNPHGCFVYAHSEHEMVYFIIVWERLARNQITFSFWRRRNWEWFEFNTATQLVGYSKVRGTLFSKCRILLLFVWATFNQQSILRYTFCDMFPIAYREMHKQ